MYDGLAVVCHDRVHVDRKVRKEVVRLGQYLFERLGAFQRLGKVRVRDCEVGGGKVVNDGALARIPGLDKLVGDGLNGRG